MSERYVIRWPFEGHPSPFGGTDGAAWLEDTVDGSLWFADGGEPEDMILCRNLKVFVDAMNRYDAENAALRDVVDAALFAKASGLVQSRTLFWALEKYTSAYPRVPPKGG